MRRPLGDSCAARDGVERALLADRGAAAHAAQQPRSRGCRAPREARRLRRLGTRCAIARRAARDRAHAAAPRRRRDVARAIRQAGRRVQDACRRASCADRERAARARLGDVGRVPPARGRRPDDVRPDDGRIVDLHRHARHPAGHVSDVLCSRRGSFRHAGSLREDGVDGGTRRHGRRPTARGDDGGRGDPLCRGRPAVDRPAARHALRRRAGLGSRRRPAPRPHGRRGAPSPVGGAPRQRGRRVPGARRPWRAFRPRHGPDCSARSADRLRARRGPVRGGGGAPVARSEALPRAGVAVDRDPCAGDVRVRPHGLLCFRLWQQPTR